MPDWKKYKSFLEDSKKILISAHTNLDGDALGSEMALAAALEHLGYDVTVLNSDPAPEQFRFIGRDFGRLHSMQEFQVGTDFFTAFDTWLIVDTSSRKQLGKIAFLLDSGIKTLVIDHHAASEQITPYNFSDSTQPAAGCLVMQLIQFLGVPLDLRASGWETSIANYLYFALATDTGWFRFPSTLPQTLRQAAELLQAGASTANLFIYANESYSPVRLKLLGKVAENSQLGADGKLAWSWLEQKDFQKFGGTLDDSKNLVNSLLITRGVQAAILFTELPSGIRINFRSREAVNIAALAQKYGGGGHKNAAGATLETPLLETIQTVITEAKRMFQ